MNYYKVHKHSYEHRLLPAMGTPTLAYFNRGLLYLLRKKYSLAYEDLTTAIAEYYNDYRSPLEEGYYYRGIVLLQMKRYREAMEDFEMIEEDKNVQKAKFATLAATHRYDEVLGINPGKHSINTMDKLIDMMKGKL